MSMADSGTVPSLVEPASTTRDHVSDAQALVSTESARRRQRLAFRLGLAAGTIAAAAVAATVIFALAPMRPPPASSTSPRPSATALSTSPSPSVAASATAVPTSQRLSPSTAPASEIDLARIGWYTLVPIAFGTLTGSAPDSPLPEPYDLLTVGTLDGRVGAELHLSSSMAEPRLTDAWANGPYGMEVLAGDDDGARSRVFTVSVLDGTERTLFETGDAVAVGAPDWAGEYLYFVPLDRATNRDLGLWRVAVAGGEPAVVFDQPIWDGAHDYASGWRIDRSPDGEALVVQVCRQRSCNTLVHRVSAEESRLDRGTPELIGVTSEEYVAGNSAVSLAEGTSRSVGHGPGQPSVVAGAGGAWYLVVEPQQADSRAYELAAWLLGEGPLRTLVSADPAVPSGAWLKFGPDAGAAPPPGWVLRWPPEGGRFHTAVPPPIWYAGELVNVVTGERLPVPPTDWPDTPHVCDPIAPSVLPSGAEPGDAITTPGGHHLWATWGTGADQVVQDVGRLPATPAGVEVSIRGLTGYVLPLGNIEGPWAIAWQEDGCQYEVQLAPGGTEAEAVEYAGRY